MHKNIKLVLVVLLSFFILQSVAHALYVEDDGIIHPNYTLFQLTDTNLSSQGEVYAEAWGTSSVVRVEISTALQRRSFLWWTNEKTWSQTFYTNNGRINTTTTLQADNRYRLYTTYTMYTSSSSETHSEYSNEVVK